jgi:hypothetical protein
VATVKSTNVVIQQAVVAHHGHSGHAAGAPAAGQGADPDPRTPPATRTPGPPTPPAAQDPARTAASGL